MKVTFLGTGANGGVPQVDCRCINCETALRNNSLIRKRSSVLVETTKHKILIDCGPDFWSQMQAANLKIQELDLIVITHLHFDHCNGLMELSGGKKWNIPVLVSNKNRQLLMKGQWGNLVERGFMQFIDSVSAQKMGVSLIEVPHDPAFPTSGVIVQEGGKKVWYSSDTENITLRMKKEIISSDLVLFDATFWDDTVFPAKKIHHMTIERSLPFFVRNKIRVVYTHINHSEDTIKIQTTLKKDGLVLAHDGMVVAM